MMNVEVLWVVWFLYVLCTSSTSSGVYISSFYSAGLTFCGYRFLKKKCSVENQKTSVLFYAASWRKCYVWPLAFSVSSVAEIRPPCRAWIEYHLNFYQ